MNTDNRNGVNFNEQQPFVVGILSPSTTLYIDHQLPPEVVIPPTDLDLRRRNTNSFQITSVTVQAGPGTRKGGNQNNNNNGHHHPNNHADDFYDDSADDLDESRTDDLSSDFLDSRTDNEGGGGYQSEDIGDDLLSSPCCGPIVFAQVPTPGAGAGDANANGTSLGVTPTYTGVVAGGVTMMTSKSESPISAQVPVMNPLPDNWQRRFKVVKIVSSEPFRRGRWLCMDFKDPPANMEGGGGGETEIGSNGGGTRTPPPTIHITGCGGGGPGSEPVAREEIGLLASGCGDFAQVYEIPINQTFSGNFVMGNQQQMYGIILPQTSHLQPVTLVQDMSLLQTLPPPMDANFNNLVNNNCNIHVVHEPGSLAMEPAYHHAATLRQVQTLVNNNNVIQPSSLSANNNNNNNNNYVSAPPQAVLNHAVVNSGGRDSPDVVMRTIGLEENSAHRVPGSSSVSILPPHRVEDVEAENTESSQTAPEKIPPSEVGHEVDPSAGSAASTGGNTVAIDNKIEQAMDLVKSHLMFAVREEVEVLKEKITELLERISQLEHENDILRANASAETLKQLSNQSQKKNGGGTTGKPQAVAPIPPST